MYTNCTIYTREEMVNENWRKMISAVLCIVWRKAFRGLIPRENWEKTALWWMRYIWRYTVLICTINFGCREGEGNNSALMVRVEDLFYNFLNMLLLQ